MNIKHKLIRFIEQPSGIIDLMSGARPIHTYYFYNVKKFTNSINTYIDIGANKGKLIEACRKVFPDCYVYAIEPIKKHINQLKNFSNITVFNCGLWDENTKKTFYHAKRDDYESSFLKPIKLDDNKIETDIEELTVEVRRLDSLPITIKRPCFIKLDVEGAEYRVLKGMGNLLNDIDFVMLEQIHVKKTESQGMTGRCISLLEDYGFTGFIQIGTTYYTNGLPSKSDLLFFKEKMAKEPWFKNKK